MQTRRSFMTGTLSGIAGIVAAGHAPVYAQDRKMKKIGVLGIGSHNFATRFKNPPETDGRPVLAKPYAIWDSCKEFAESRKGDVFEKVYDDPVKLAKDCDCIHIEHGDYRKSLELAQPGLEMGKPTFINRPFTASIEDAEEIVRLARTYDAPLMSASSLEFGGEIPEIHAFLEENGPLRAYEAYGPEAHFTWHFPHVINYTHSALGGGIDNAWFTGHFGIDMRKWRVEGEEVGPSVCVLTHKPRDGHPPAIGMCHIGNYKGQFHIHVYCHKANKDFELSGAWSDNMFAKLNGLYSYREVPRPYEAILEMHRTLVAVSMSRETGRAVELYSLGGKDALPYTDGIRRYVMRDFIAEQKPAR